VTDTIKSFWDNMSGITKAILFFLAISASFGSGQLVMNPQVKLNKEMAEANRIIAEGNSSIAQNNHTRLDNLTKNVEFLTQVAVATAKNAGIDTEEIRRKVEREFRQLEAMSK
jgi:hypothetical protein